MVVKPFVLDVPSFNGGLHATVAAEPLPIPTRPIDRILVSIVDPVFVVVVDQHHAASPV